MKKIILLISISFLFVGCLGTKKTTEKTTEIKTTEKETSSKNSLSAAIVNQAIEDAIKMYVPKSETNNKEFDLAVNDAVDKILLKLNQNKSSGSNGYVINYDKIKRELLLELNVGETKSTEIKTNQTTVKERTFEQKTDEYILKKVNSIPWWIWIIAIIYFLPSLINAVMSIITPFKNLIKK